MKIRCKKCKKICADIKSRPAIEQYLAGNYGIVCEYCGEDNWEKEEEIKDILIGIEKIEESLKKEIEKKYNFNEIIEKIYFQYPNIPTEKLQKNVHDFLDKLNTLDSMYKNSNKKI